jgi:rhombotail lipoprotein
VLRAGGTHTWHGTSTLIDADRNSREAGAAGFDKATDEMISNFDTALTAFEADVHEGRANVRIVRRGERSAASGGGGALELWELLALLSLAGGRMTRISAIRQLAGGRWAG